MANPLDERIWTAALLIIGDEILSGRTQDKNIAQVALWLNLQGIRLAEWSPMCRRRSARR
jgi:molybdopterin-biosynthesis enzyme MoeA-like protein